ncbi:MAG: prepilin-type N-terminal cleavage/methylation domain-containing protein [Luteolibacter sp.]
MKLNTRNIARKSGMTLLELTVVILVLLSLISILFVGARAWKKGSDRAANIMNIRNVQQAVRGHANMNALNDGATLDSATIMSETGSSGYLKTPTPPADLDAYTYLSVVPEQGTLYVTNNLTGDYGFTNGSTDYANW